jgi:membrane protease YdiL (CAAX protease family)
MQWRSAAGAIFFTYAAARGFWWTSAQSWRVLDDVWFEGLLKTLVWVGPAVLVLILIRRLTLHEAWRELGLEASVVRGYGFGLLATLPMALAVPFGQVHAIDPAVFAGTVLLGPFAEEVLFRGFLFRQLLTRARWPLGWAIGVSAVAFALAHHRDVDEELVGRLIRMSFGLQPHGLDDLFIRIGATIAVFAPGGALFAWIVYRFNNLWPAIGLHASLNLWWILTQGADVSGGFTLDAAGIAQAVSLVFALFLTFSRVRRRFAVA